MRISSSAHPLSQLAISLLASTLTAAKSHSQLPTLQLVQSPHRGPYTDASWSALTNNLAGCPSDTYVLATFNAKAIETPHAEWIPERVGSPIDGLEALQLMSAEGLDMASAHSAYVEMDDIARRIVAEHGLEGMKELLEKKCGAKSMVANLKTGGLEPITDNQPRIILGDFINVANRDSILASRELMQQYETERKGIHSSITALLRLLPTKSVTIIYLTSPSTEYAIIDPSIPTEHRQAVHGDLRKRSEEVYLSATTTLAGKNSSSSQTPTPLPMPSNLPVFEKYSFFSPGIFAGLGITLLLTMILIVAVRGVASIEIPYGAFEKDSNPQQAAKNQ